MSENNKTRLYATLLIALAIIGVSVPIYIYLFHTIPSDFTRTSPSAHIEVEVSTTYTKGDNFYIVLSISNKGDSPANITKIYINENTMDSISSQAYIDRNNRLEPIENFIVPPHTTLYVTIKVPKEIAECSGVIIVELVTASGASFEACVNT